MGIWIMSQNRKVLVNANDIWYHDRRILGNCGADEESAQTLGNYPTEAEALLVLEDIYVFLQMPNRANVFEMPAAGFSKEATPNDRP